MANKRPIRAPRQGWRRGRRRPTRWVDCFSTGLSSTNTRGCPWALLNPTLSNVSSITAREIIAGDIDTAVLDRQEVRIDRVVGDLHFWTASMPDLNLVRPPVVRIGLLVEEDSGEASSTAGIDLYDLWNPTGIQTMEWMYLEEIMLEESGITAPAEEVGFRVLTGATHLDIRSKRKLGKADRLWLVMTYGNGAEGSGVTTNTWASEVWESHMLRAVIVT